MCYLNQISIGEKVTSSLLEGNKHPLFVLVPAVVQLPKGISFGKLRTGYQEKNP